VGPAPGGRSLDQVKTLRQEDAHQRAHLEGDEARNGAPVDAQVLGLAGLEPGFDLVSRLVVARLDHHARDGCAAADELALV
jgi:hypothetical protein